jgi:hypothetical protein
MVVFLIDLWDPAGSPPQTINAVLWRAKQIQYASRAAHQVDAVATKVNLRYAVRLLKAAGVPDVAAVPNDPLLTARLDIVHIVYRPGLDQIPNSDAEFSRSSIAERREAGYRDMRAALVAEPWLRQEMPGTSRRAGASGGAGEGDDAPRAQPAHDDRQAGSGLTGGPFRKNRAALYGRSTLRWLNSSSDREKCDQTLAHFDLRPTDRRPGGTACEQTASHRPCTHRS